MWVFPRILAARGSSAAAGRALLASTRRTLLQPQLELRHPSVSPPAAPSRTQGAYRSAFSFFLFVPLCPRFLAHSPLLLLLRPHVSVEVTGSGVCARTRAIWAPGLRGSLAQRLLHTRKHTRAATDIYLPLIPISHLYSTRAHTLAQAKHLRKLVSLCVHLFIPIISMLA